MLILLFIFIPPILLFNIANQSATQNINIHPALANLFTLIAFSTP
jgi:hypothetical protein